MMLWKISFMFKLYNNNIGNNTQLQIGHKVILLGGESIRHIFGQGKPLELLPWIINPILLVPAVTFELTASQSLSGGVNT